MTTIVSFSEIYSFQTCLRAYFYGHTLDLRPIDERGSLKKGIYGHGMLQSYYNAVRAGKNLDDAMAQVLDELPTDLEPEMLSSYALVHNFVKQIDMEIRSHEILHVEEPMYHKADSELTIGYTPDLILRKNKENNIEDAKFVGRAWPKARLTRYTQLDIYNALCRKEGLPIARGVARFFNVETGRINKQIYEPSEERLQNIYDEFIAIAYQVKNFKETPVAEQKEMARRTLNYTICQWCDFVLPCDFELSGKDASKTLLTQYVSRDYGYEKLRRSGT